MRDNISRSSIFRDSMRRKAEKKQNIKKIADGHFLINDTTVKTWRERHCFKT